MSDLRDAALRVVVAADAFLEYERGGSLGMPRPAVPERTEMRNSLAALRDLLSNPTSSVSTEGAGLSEAWAAAVEALPKGLPAAITIARYPDDYESGGSWTAFHPLYNWRTHNGDGPTPTAALQALAARLTAINPDSPVEPDRG